jgi:Zn-dependent protease
MTTPTPEKPAASASPSIRNPWSFRIATVFGIPIYLHFTFLLLLIFLALGSVSQERGFAPARLFFVIALFACVALHELGHSVVALRYKIPVADITLYPIGGIARIEKQPTPVQELWIALAGPAVNIVIAIVLNLALIVSGHPITQTDPIVAAHPQDWVGRVIGANVWLALFNLIPAFPMDGGRVLRAVLSMRMPFNRATEVAASIGQTLAMVAGLVAVFSGQWGLLFIALFIFLGAGQEVTVAQQETLIKNVTAREAMMTDIRTLPHGATFREAADLLLATSQQDFPIVLGEEVIGILSRNSLLRGLAAEGPDAYIASAMQREFVKTHPDDDLSDLLRHLQQSHGPALVFEGDRLAGMVTMENFLEFLAIQQIKSERQDYSSASATR